MSTERPPDLRGAHQPVHIRLVFCADPAGVRTALRRLITDLEGFNLPLDARSAAEIVLAEALNNIVEHAYAERGGEIDLVLEPGPSGMRCAITDRGAPMPGLALPEGRLPPPGPEVPEGGFGWHLIRSLARDLEYERQDGFNRLRFNLPTAPEGDNPAG